MCLLLSFLFYHLHEVEYKAKLTQQHCSKPWDCVYCISLVLGWWGVGPYVTQWEIHARLIASAAVHFGIALPVISLYTAHISSMCDMVQLPSQYTGQGNNSYRSHPCLVCLLDLKARIYVAYIHAYVSFTLCFSFIWSQKQLLGVPILQLWLSINSRDQHPMWVTATSFHLLLPSIIWPPFMYNERHNWTKHLSIKRMQDIYMA